MDDRSQDPCGCACRCVASCKLSLMTRFVVSMLLAGMMVLGADVASGQNYPVKPVRVLTAEPGGGLDVAARIIAQGLTGGLGKQVIVENHGAGAFAAEIVAKAPP